MVAGGAAKDPWSVRSSLWFWFGLKAPDVVSRLPFSRRMRAGGLVAFERGRVKITPTKIGFSSKLGQKWEILVKSAPWVLLSK